MKTKVIELSYEKVQALPIEPHKKPHTPSALLRWVARIASAGELKATGFTWTEEGMEKLGKKEPCLILMNHSCFLDLKMAMTIFKNRPFNIVSTSDGFVGKEWLMHTLGCIPTHKFVTDVTLVRDMMYALHTLKSSVLMYPEASYSFDGTQTTFSAGLAKSLKLLNVPVVMVTTEGAFHHDPLYNNLQLRNVTVKAHVTYLLSPEDIQAKTVEAIDEILQKAFTLDYFAWQRDNNVPITEPFRADYLNRVLYKCPVCGQEGKTLGKGTTLTCNACDSQWTMKENGQMESHTGETHYPHIPDWYRWQRECVRKELEDGTYRLEVDVDIYLQRDNKAIYRVGEGHLTHDATGFTLIGCNDENGRPQLEYRQGQKASHSLYADYYWYEIGDMICIGNMKTLYYCFPKNAGDIVAKTRLATEELYRMSITAGCR